MDLKSYNKALATMCKQALNCCFISDIDQGFSQYSYCSDTDTVRYKIITSRNKFVLLFYFIDLENIWKFIEPYFRQTYYQNFSVALKKDGSETALEIMLDQKGFTALNKSTPQPEAVGVTTGKKSFDYLFDLLSKRIASIKRHFLASPFQIMLDAARANAADKGNRTVPNFSFDFKPDRKEKVWLAFEKNQITVYFGLHFDDRFEQQLGKIFFSELIDSKKHVHNSPAVMVSEREIPRLLIDSFPEEKMQKYSFANGIVSFSNNGLTQLFLEIQSRIIDQNYAYYHIQSWKVYLHSRVLRRIGIILKDLNHAKIEPFALE